MPGLKLHLLGPPRFELEDMPLELRRRKVLALFVYLAVTAQRHSRDVLTELLYPKQDRSRARSDFRQTLSLLRSSVGSDWIRVDRNSISIPSRNDLWIDVHEFRGLVGQSGRMDQGRKEFQAENTFTKAAELYRGEFLSGFYLKDSFAFEEWQLFEQESLKQEYAYILEGLGYIYMVRGEFQRAIEYGRKWLSLDSLDETVHRHLMRLYCLIGQRSAALKQYEKCRSLLKNELGETPDEETAQLYRQIQSGELVAREPQTEATLQQKWDRPALQWRIPRKESRSVPRVLPEGTVVFLMTDVDGISQFINSQQEKLEVDFAQRKSFVESVIEEKGGQIFGSKGGSLYAVFETASTAVSAALDAQITLQRKAWRLSDTGSPDRLPSDVMTRHATGLRMALHVGRAERREKEYFGSIVNRASVLLSAARGGQILLSDVAAALAKDSLPRGATLRSLGSHRLKDLGPPLSIFQLTHPNFVSDFSPLRTLDSLPNNLSVQPTSLIGRESELTDVFETLMQKDRRILTLSGTGGTGKTRLAQQAAAELTDRFEHGVFFVDLAALSDPDQVVSAIARTLDVRETMGEARPLFETLKDYLKNREMLLLLDNFEHILPAAEQVAELLATCPRLKVLVTSRAPLHLKGEQEIAVSPLSLPPLGQSVERLNQYDAVQLFAERALSVRSDFAITKENASTVTEICVRLDGLPLAIELATSRLKVLSPQDLLKKLAHRLELLKGGPRDLPVRQQTLRNTIDWSFDLLDAGEKRLFARLSVFVGNCSLQAAEEVCSDEASGSKFGVLDSLTSLVDKNLLRRYEVEGETRFWMLETIREYSRMRLEESPDADEVKQRFAKYFLELAEQADPKLHGPDQMEWLDRLERDNNNLQEAMEWFLNNEMAGESLRLAVALEWFWYRYGHFSDGKKWLEAAHNLAGEAVPSDVQAKALHALGWMLMIQGEWKRARFLHADSLEMYQKLGDRLGESIALSDLGVVERFLGEISKGTGHVEEAVRIAREVGDPLRLAIALIWAYATTGGRFVGKAPQAELEEAVALSRKLGNLWGVSHGLNGLGDMFRELGEYKKARLRYEEGLRGFQELKDRWMTAWTLEGLGRVSYLDGDNRNAVEYFREGIALFDSLGDRGSVALMFRRLGMVARSEDDHPRAACLLGAYKTLQEAIIGRESVEHMEYSPDVITAFTEYQNDFEADWNRGQAMSYEQAVECALGSSTP